MPTGYTAPIEEGNTNARDFVTHCARAFGVFVHQREEDIDIPPTPVEVVMDSYYARALVEADAELSELKALSPEEIESRYNQYFDEVTQSNVDSILRYREMVAKYQSVKDKVDSWEPNKEAEPLKEYCLDQLSVSWPHEPHITEPYETPEDWYDHELAYEIRNVEYYENHIKEKRDFLAERRVHAIKMLESIADVEE